MKKFCLLSIIVLLFLSFSVTNAQKKQFTVPDDWKKNEECGITFSIPSEFEKEDVRGKDSCFSSFRSKNILLSLDVLFYIGKESDSRKDEVSDEKDFKISKLKIDGRKAEIITYYETENKEQWKDLLFNATLFVPVIDKKEGGNLTMWANCRSEKDREIAKKIFETVRF